MHALARIASLIIIIQGGLAAASFSQGPVLPPAKMEGRGSVVLDVIDSATNRAVAGVPVRLAPGHPNDAGAAYERLSWSVRTDQQGHARVEDLSPGVYKLHAEKEGYAPYDLLLAVTAGSTSARRIELSPQVKISGRVIGEKDEPVSDARIGLTLESQASLANWLLTRVARDALTATTDRDGRFELLLPVRVDEEARVAVVASTAGYATSRPETITIAKGKATGTALLRLRRGLQASGRILDEHGAPLSGVTIRARQAMGRNPAFDDEEPRATSGRDGTFVLRGLEESTYTFEVTHPEYVTRVLRDVELRAGALNVLPDVVLEWPAEISGRVIDHKGAPIVAAKIRALTEDGIDAETTTGADGRFALRKFASGEHVRVGAEAAGTGDATASISVEAPRNDVVLVLSPLGVLRGRVLDADTGQPITEFRIRSRRERTFHSVEGKFEWPGLATGRWQFTATAEGYARTTVNDVLIRSAEPTDEVTFSLKRAVSLSGRIVDGKTGLPLPGITVRCVDAKHALRPDWMIWILGDSQVTDSQGQFRFDGLPPTPLVVVATASLFAEARARVTAGETDSLEIRLWRGTSSISGNVLAADATVDVRGSQVDLRNGGGSAGPDFMTRDEGGAFSFYGLTAGRYQLTASQNGLRSRSEEVVLDEGESLTGVVLVLPGRTGTTLIGRVSGILASERTAVSVSAGANGAGASGITGSDGTFELHGLPAGMLKVRCETWNYSGTLPSREIETSVNVPEGVQTVNFDITLPTTGRVSGRITNAGIPVPFVDTVAVPSDPRMAFAYGPRTDEDGFYSIEGLSDGKYFVGTKKGGKRAYVSGDTRVDIDLSRP